MKISTIIFRQTTLVVFLFFAFSLSVFGAEETATLSFANKAQRTSLSTSKQVWEQNGIKLTNDKGSSTSNVADYANPARFYKSSKISANHELLKKTFTEHKKESPTLGKLKISPYLCIAFEK